MKAKAIISLKLTPKKKLIAAFDALEPEITATPGSRSQARLETEGNLLVLMIGAEDTVALRAALNAYLRWISSMLNVFQMLEREKKEQFSQT